MLIESGLFCLLVDNTINFASDMSINLLCVLIEDKNSNFARECKLLCLLVERDTVKQHLLVNDHVSFFVYVRTFFGE